MTNYKLHNDCKVLSGYVYKDNKPEKLVGWAYLPNNTLLLESGLPV